jgi:hypothetical protein
MKLWDTIKSVVKNVAHTVSSWFAKSQSSLKSELVTIDEKLSKIRTSHSTILGKVAEKQGMIKAAQGNPQGPYIEKTANRLIAGYVQHELKIKEQLNFWQHKREQYINKHAEKLAENITSTIPTITFEL